VRMLDLLEDFAVRNVRGTGGFTGETADTFRSVKVGPGVLD